MTRRGKIALKAGAAAIAFAALLGLSKSVTNTPDVPQPKGGGKPPKVPVVPPPEAPPRPGLLFTTNVPPVTVDATRLEPGWVTMGWYTYVGASKRTNWIRIDKGPWRSGMVTEQQPWRWTWIEGSTPLATEEHTFSQIDVLEGLIGPLWEGRNDEIMLATMPCMAADWIDTAYGGGQ